MERTPDLSARPDHLGLEGEKNAPGQRLEPREEEAAFCTAVNCIDGRVQVPVIQYLQHRLGVAYVDMVTEPGPVRFLADDSSPEASRSILKRIGLSIKVHDSQAVAVVAHEDCAGNPVGREEQLESLESAVQALAAHYPGVQLLGLWVSLPGEVVEVCRLEPATD